MELKKNEMKNKLVLFLLLVLLYLGKITAQSCLAEGITLTTQEQIDNFPKNHLGCTEILKYVDVKESIIGEITNLDSLRQIIKINGNLLLRDNANLVSINGLKNLNTIGGKLFVSNNTSLTNLNGLENLTSVGQYLKIKNNASLTNFSGLNNLTLIGGYLDINDNASLVNLDSLENLTIVGEIVPQEARPIHKIWVTPRNNTSRLIGYLSEVGDSLIIVSSHLNQSGFTEDLQSIDFQNIETIKFRKKGKVGNSILIGALSGVAIGAIVGFASGDDNCSGGLFSSLFCYTKEQKAVLGGVSLLLPGVLIGAVAGSIKIEIPINGDYQTFKKKRGELMKFRM
jgi:hypothetical protein